MDWQRDNANVGTNFLQHQFIKIAKIVSISTLDSSLSAGSEQNLATKGSFCGFFHDLHKCSDAISTMLYLFYIFASVRHLVLLFSILRNVRFILPNFAENVIDFAGNFTEIRGLKIDQILLQISRNFVDK